MNTTTASLEKTEWQVIAINGQATPQTDVYRMQFRDGQAGGRFGCNQFGGRYRVAGGTLVATDIASTLMGCPEPAATFEQRGLAVLQQPMRMIWEADRRLTLSNGAGSISLDLIRRPAADE